MISRSRTRHVVLVLLLAGALLAAPTLAAAASAEDGDPGDNLSVDVVDDSEATPTPTPSPTASQNGGGGGGGGGGSDPTPSATPSSSPTPGPEAESGVLQVGGLVGSSSPAWNPLEGTVSTRMTVHNGLATAITATARFELQTVGGQRLGRVVTLKLVKLKPGESREVSAVLTGAGQWTLVRVVATVTPPKDFHGVKLEPIERETWVFVAPWLVLVLIVLLAATGAILWVLRGRIWGTS